MRLICEYCGRDTFDGQKCLHCGCKLVPNRCDICGEQKMIPLGSKSSPPGIVCSNGCTGSAKIYQFGMKGGKDPE
jgi:hypothetical protein